MTQYYAQVWTEVSRITLERAVDYNPSGFLSNYSSATIVQSYQQPIAGDGPQLQTVYAILISTGQWSPADPFLYTERPTLPDTSHTAIFDNGYVHFTYADQRSLYNIQPFNPPEPKHLDPTAIDTGSPVSFGGLLNELGNSLQNLWQGFKPNIPPEWLKILSDPTGIKSFSSTDNNSPIGNTLSFSDPPKYFGNDSDYYAKAMYQSMASVLAHTDSISSGKDSAALIVALNSGKPGAVIGTVSISDADGNVAEHTYTLAVETVSPTDSSADAGIVIANIQSDEVIGSTEPFSPHTINSVIVAGSADFVSHTNSLMDRDLPITDGIALNSSSYSLSWIYDSNTGSLTWLKPLTASEYSMAVSMSLSKAQTDFNADGTSDVLFINTVTHDADSWTIVNGKWAGSSDLGTHPGSGWQVGGIADFNTDGTKDVLWFNQATGETDTWLLQNGHWSASVNFGNHPGASTVVGVGDFNNDGTSDVLWFDQSTGKVDEWKISDGKWAGSVDIGAHPGSGWTVSGTGDYNGDHTSDVLWVNAATGDTDIWEMKNGNWSASVSPGTHPPSSIVAGTGDFNGDGTSDILWFNPSTNDLDLWKISNGNWAGSVDLGAHPGTGWHVAGTGDYNGDGTSDILWSNASTGQNDIWLIANDHWAGSVDPGTHAAADWVIPHQT